MEPGADERGAVNVARAVVRRDLEAAREMIREVVPQYKSLLITHRQDLMDYGQPGQVEFRTEYGVTLIIADGLSFCAVGKPTAVAAVQAIIQRMTAVRESVQLPMGAVAAAS